MNDEIDTTSTPEPAVAEKTTAAKKPATRKPRTKRQAARSKRSKTPRSKASNRKAATDSQRELVAKLRQDLKDVKETIKVARATAKYEIALLKEQLDAALKREKELVKISEKKTRKMLAAGERWEKKQVAKMMKSAEKARKLIKK